MLEQPTGRAILELLEGRTMLSAGSNASEAVLVSQPVASIAAPAGVGRPLGNHVTFWKLRGEGAITPNPDGSFTATYSGTAGLIGKYTAVVRLVIAANGTDFTGSGTYTAANGDTLDFEFQGSFAYVLGSQFPNPAVGTGVYIGGTGRFVGATGFDTFDGVVQADLSFTFQHEAQLRW
jgi:hypothetical protein